GREGRIQVGHDPHAPAGRIGPAAVGTQGVELGRRELLVALGERILCGVDACVARVLARKPWRSARALRALAGDDRLVPAERVYSEFRHLMLPAAHSA